MAASWVKIYLPQNYFAIRSVCENRWQIKLTGFSAESLLMPYSFSATLVLDPFSAFSAV